jgi:hypothetical protein
MPKDKSLEPTQVTDRFSEFAARIVAGELRLPASLDGGEPHVDTGGACDATWDNDWVDFDNNR